jgi:hypothetical protein
MDTSAIQTLDQIVKGVVLQGGYGMDDWDYVYPHVIDAIRELHMFHTTKFKISKVFINPDINTVDWPDDYIGEGELGVPTHDGKLRTLTRKDSLIPTTTLINGQETLDSTIGEGVKFHRSPSYGYGIHGGVNNLYYTYDQNNRRFVINGWNPLRDKQLYLSYVSSGVVDKDTLIPVKYKEAIYYYVRKHMAEREDRKKFNEADYFERQYDSAVSKLRAFEFPTLDEMYDALYSNFTGSIGR